ncbi:hypothetical protein GJV26_11325 [Massilia dura]|uniref:Uncharacterized protein n=1 Tax=Pseudoduganella dura TaxID=321982 RepID=A0A6I3X9Z0_9BURK|nr:hypothetical protein [Pseudoduganella dura]MUI13047.1 hypothetical protein [Pseudoduganella dura]GGX87651.1 hypothetical protein GCM10007386_18110 [Pseudoduganella dura]
MNRFWTLKQWLLEFLLEWIIPKFSVAAGVSAVSAVFFSLDPSTPVSTKANEKFNAIFSLISYDWFVPVTVAFGILLIISISIRGHANGSRTKFHAFSLHAEKLSKALNFLYGCTLVPLVVICTASVMHRGAGSENIGSMAFLALSYVLIGAGVHLLGKMDSHPWEGLSYVVYADHAIGNDAFGFATLARLEQMMAYLPWAGDVVVGIESHGGFTTLSIPLHLKAASWDDEELEWLRRATWAVEIEWQKLGLHYERTMSVDMERRFRSAVYSVQGKSSSGKVHEYVIPCSNRN